MGGRAQKSGAVVCVGTAALDTIAVAARMPGPDERIEADELITAGGGPAATAAVTLARLGVPVEFAGVVGDDASGRTILEGLEAEGVGVSLVERRPGVTSTHSLVLVSADTAARAIVTRPSPARPTSVPGGFAWTHVDQAGYPALHAHQPVGTKVSLDDGNPVAPLDLSLVDLYVPTATVLARRFGSSDPVRSARVAMRAGAGAVVATDGAAGSMVVDPQSAWRLPGLGLEVRSTLGAGDVFHGALLAGLYHGRSLPEAARFANACAALSCRALDGRSGIPDLAEVESVLPRLPEPIPDDLATAGPVHTWTREHTR